MNIKIGAKIRSLRRENNVTQDTLAAAIGVTPQAVSRWEAELLYVREVSKQQIRFTQREREI